MDQPPTIPYVSPPPHHHSSAQSVDTSRNPLEYNGNYRVAHKKRPQLCNDVVLLNNRIQTKRNNFFKEQS